MQAQQTTRAGIAYVSYCTKSQSLIVHVGLNANNVSFNLLLVNVYSTLLELSLKVLVGSFLHSNTRVL